MGERTGEKGVYMYMELEGVKGGKERERQCVECMKERERGAGERSNYL